MNKNYRSLVASILIQAFRDIKGIQNKRGANGYNHAQRVKLYNEALEFLNSLDCETYCEMLDVDYKVVREKIAPLELVELDR